MKKFILIFVVICCALLFIIGGFKPVSAKDNTITVTDIDGNIYQTIKIGNQVWMAENLKTTKYNDGTLIPLVTNSAEWGKLTTPGYCWYDNDIKNKSKYGALYNWYAVNTKKLAPKGWHIPTDAEWEILQNYLIANGYNWDGTTTDNKIAKSMTAKTDWETHTKPGTPGKDLPKNNKSGFSALPSGFRVNGGLFRHDGRLSYWWSATIDDASYAFSRSLFWGLGHLYKSSDFKSDGFSVRLVRGE